MEENVALDSKKQRKFVKSIKGIQKLIKKNEKNEAKSEPKKKDDQAKPEKPFSMRLKDGKVKKSRKEKGLVYLGHIPHGFYEHQMTQYFKQFGVVTNARVIKSKKTGNSKGFAFVEFKETSVAQIVAETMNNYLMGKRLIKAVYIPPEEQKRRVFRKKWNSVNNPASIKRMKCKKEFNADKDDAGDLKKARRLLANLNKTQKKLSELGINYNFSPVDVPEALLDRVVKKEKVEEPKEENSNPKKGKKEDKKVVQNEKQNGKKTDSNKKDNVVNKKVADKASTKTNKKDTKPAQVNEKVQKDKEKKLKDAGVKSVDEFIGVGGEDSDESCEFDSDEYEKMLEEDDEETGDEESGEESGEDQEDSEVEDEEDGEDEDEEDSEEESEEEEAPPPKKGKGKPQKVVQPVQTKKQTQKQAPQAQQAKKQDVKPLEVKRKNPQRQQVAGKKPKFEKQNQKPMKKQFKKK